MLKTAGPARGLTVANSALLSLYYFLEYVTGSANTKLIS